MHALGLLHIMNYCTYIAIPNISITIEGDDFFYDSRRGKEWGEMKVGERSSILPETSWERTIAILLYNFIFSAKKGS